MPLEHYYVTRLPIGGVFEIERQGFGVPLEEYTQVAHAAEVDVGVGLFNFRICVGGVRDVAVNQRFEIVAGGGKGVPDNVGAHALTVVGVAPGVVFAAVDRVGRYVGKRAVLYIGVIVHTVAVGVKRASYVFKAEVGGIVYTCHLFYRKHCSKRDDKQCKRY